MSPKQGVAKMPVIQKPIRSQRGFSSATIDILGHLHEARTEIISTQSRAGHSDAGWSASILRTKAEELIALVEYYGANDGLETSGWSRK